MEQLPAKARSLERIFSLVVMLFIQLDRYTRPASDMSVRGYSGVATQAHFSLLLTTIVEASYVLLFPFSILLASSLHRSDDTNTWISPLQAFSGISTGVYGYPINAATRVALDVVRSFLISPEGAHVSRIQLNWRLILLSLMYLPYYRSPTSSSPSSVRSMSIPTPRSFPNSFLLRPSLRWRLTSIPQRYQEN